MNNIKLKDLLDMESLQLIQDYYAKITGIASIITDENGIPITTESNFTDFCSKLTRGASKEGLRRCEACDAKGAKLTLDTGRPQVYQCHAGLCDFAAPIKVDNKIIGSFVAGQVLTAPLSEELVRDIAFELQLNPDVYYEASKKVPIMSKERIRECAEFIFQLANVLSETAYSNYLTQRRNRELENLLNMRTEIITNLSSSLTKTMNRVKNLSEDIAGENISESAKENLEEINRLTQMVNDSLLITSQFIEDSNADENVEESRYSLNRLCDGIRITSLGKLMESSTKFEMTIDEDVPNNLYGDVTRIRQIVSQFIDNSITFSKGGFISVHVSCKKTAYGLTLIFEITDSDGHLTNEQAELIQKYIGGDTTSVGDEDPGKLALSFSQPAKLLAAVYGSVKVFSNGEKGTTFRISIPQIEY